VLKEALVTDMSETFRALADAERTAHARMCELVPAELRPRGASPRGQAFSDTLGVVSSESESPWLSDLARLNPEQRSAAEAYDEARLRVAVAFLSLDFGGH
jgi:hypothetical protein